jgi:hypothetical protein
MQGEGERTAGLCAHLGGGKRSKRGARRAWSYALHMKVR